MNDFFIAKSVYNVQSFLYQSKQFRINFGADHLSIT
jgi:hypothetical protein